MRERSFASLLMGEDSELPALASLRDADFRYQARALALGYNSLQELCLDEMLGLLRELRGRVEYLEGAHQRQLDAGQE